MRTERERLAWALVGWFNLMAFVMLGLVIAPIFGYDVLISWHWIVGAAVLTLVVASGLLFLLLRLK
jgi:hypothetical protein